ncbi:MAG TPA: transposase, partial [Anaerolineae bacterium]
ILFLTSCKPSDAGPAAAPHGTLPGTVGRVVQAFKSLTTRAYAEGVRHKGWPELPGRLWQRNYYDRVIRSERELAAIRQYIEDNPASWPGDAEYEVGP